MVNKLSKTHASKRISMKRLATMCNTLQAHSQLNDPDSYYISISPRRLEYLRRWLTRGHSKDPHAHRQAAYRQRCIDKFGGRPDREPLARARWAASKLPHLVPIITLGQMD
jgi:hypothetical protein